MDAGAETCTNVQHAHTHTNTHQTKKPLDVSFTLSPKGLVHISNTQTIIEGGNFHYNTCFSIDLTF